MKELSTWRHEKCHSVLASATFLELPTPSSDFLPYSENRRTNDAGRCPALPSRSALRLHVSGWSRFHISLGAPHGYNCKEVPSTASRKAARGSLRDWRARYHGRRCYFRSAIEVFHHCARASGSGYLQFFFNRTATDLTSYPFIKDLTLEEYLDSRLGLDHDNHQVRMLSN